MTTVKDLAIHYFELSNQRKLDEIRLLFTTSSTYSSVNAGIFLGANDIMTMQTRFFARFKSMQWQIVSMDEIKPGVVFFDFIFTGQTIEGETIRLAGEEYVVVYEGKIQHVEVRNKP